MQWPRGLLALALAALLAPARAAAQPASAPAREVVFTSQSPGAFLIKVIGPEGSSTCELSPDRPACSLLDLPVGPVDVAVQGTFDISQKLTLPEGQSVVEVKRRGYALALGGAALLSTSLVVTFLGALIGGVGDPEAQKDALPFLLAGGAGLGGGVLMIGADLFRPHRFLKLKKIRPAP
jgi:hypothetical protein